MEQTLPQSPQLLESTSTEVHISLQSVVPAGHPGSGATVLFDPPVLGATTVFITTQFPLRQILAASQGVEQLPQWSALLCRLTHSPAQAVVADGQVPSLQTILELLRAVAAEFAVAPVRGHRRSICNRLELLLALRRRLALALLLGIAG